MPIEDIVNDRILAAESGIFPYKIRAHPPEAL